MYLLQHARNITTLLFLVLSLSRITAQAIPDTVACAPSTQISTQLSLLFVGDFMQHVAQIEAAQTDSGYCYNDCWQYVRDEISQADIAVGNFETTLGGKPYSGYPSFSAPDEFFTSLVDAGFDIFLTSNNHSLDTGKRSIERTISQMNKVENIAQVGTYIDRADRDKRYPYIFEKNGIKIGLVGATQILNGTAPKIDAENRDFALTRLTEEMVKSQISACTGAGAEFIIIMVHWGYEHQSTEDESQRRFAAKLIDWGADAIIGAHSHCPQPMEWIDAERDGRAIRVPVVYSLGNFISNMSQEYAKIGVFARIRITRDENGVRCEELACLPLYCCRAVPADGGREIHRTLPCFIENGTVSNDAGMDESVLRAMQKAYDHVAAVCIGEREDIHMIERSEIYAGEA